MSNSNTHADISNWHGSPSGTAVPGNITSAYNAADVMEQVVEQRHESWDTDYREAKASKAARAYDIVVAGEAVFDHDPDYSNPSDYYGAEELNFKVTLNNGLIKTRRVIPERPMYALDGQFSDIMDIANGTYTWNTYTTNCTFTMMPASGAVWGGTAVVAKGVVGSSYTGDIYYGSCNWTGTITIADLTDTEPASTAGMIYVPVTAGETYYVHTDLGYNKAVYVYTQSSDGTKLYRCSNTLATVSTSTVQVGLAFIVPDDGNTYWIGVMYNTLSQVTIKPSGDTLSAAQCGTSNLPVPYGTSRILTTDTAVRNSAMLSTIGTHDKQTDYYAAGSHTREYTVRISSAYSTYYIASCLWMVNNIAHSITDSNIAVIGRTNFTMKVTVPCAQYTTAIDEDDMAWFNEVLTTDVAAVEVTDQCGNVLSSWCSDSLRNMSYSNRNIYLINKALNNPDNWELGYYTPSGTAPADSPSGDTYYRFKYVVPAMRRVYDSAVFIKSPLFNTGAVVCRSINSRVNSTYVHYSDVPQSGITTSNITATEVSDTDNIHKVTMSHYYADLLVSKPFYDDTNDKDYTPASCLKEFGYIVEILNDCITERSN